MHKSSDVMTKLRHLGLEMVHKGLVLEPGSTDPLKNPILIRPSEVQPDPF
jgi:hypothetical protein